AKMLAQIERQLRYEELIARHYEGNLMCNEPVTIVIGEASGHQDDRCWREMALEQVSVLCDACWRVIEIGACDHQDAFTAKDTTGNERMALIENARNMPRCHGFSDFQWRLQHMLDIAAKRVEDSVLIRRKFS